MCGRSGPVPAGALESSQPSPFTVWAAGTKWGDSKLLEVVWPVREAAGACVGFECPGLSPDQAPSASLESRRSNLGVEGKMGQVSYLGDAAQSREGVWTHVFRTQVGNVLSLGPRYPVVTVCLLSCLPTRRRLTRQVLTERLRGRWRVKWVGE